MRNKLISLILFLILTLQHVVAQDSTFTKLWTNGNKKEKGFFSNHKRTGIWKTWNEKGELITLQNYNNDTLISKVINKYYTHTKGLLFNKKTYNLYNKLIEDKSYNYNNDEYKVTYYYNSGIKQSSGIIKSNLREGKWFFYKENGDFLSKKNYKNNIEIIKPKKILPSEILARKKAYTWITNNELHIPNLYKNTDWIKGFIIPKSKNNGFSKDTIFGDISFAKNITGNHFYKIKMQSKSGETTKFQASEITSFMRGTDHYISGFFKNNHSFAYQLITGKVSLFTNIQSSSIFSKNSVSSIKGFKLMTSVSNLNYYITLPNSRKMILFPIRSSHKKFVAFIKNHFSDNSELIDLVTYKVLSPKDVIEIITYYNKNHPLSN